MNRGADRRLYLIRHGETEGESSVRFHGRNDVALDDRGRAQVRGLSGWLPDLPTAVVHSPLLRARESAEILAAAKGWAPELLEVEPGFVEISFGHCEGLTAEEIRDRFPDYHAAWQAGEAVDFPGGEPRASFAARVIGAFQRVLQRHPAGDLVVVAHRGVVRHGMRLLLGIPPQAEDDFAVDLGSLTVLRAAGSLAQTGPGRAQASGPARYEIEHFNLVANPEPEP